MARTRSTLIQGGTVVPMATRAESYAADVLIEGNTILRIAPCIAPPAGCDVVDARAALVLPGFVQTHVHVIQSLARHRAEGLALLDWLRRRIWPYEAALSPEDARAAARLGVAELLLSGTATALDMGTTRHQDEVFGVAEELGIRFISGKCHMDTGDGVPVGLLEDLDASLAEAERLGTRWHGAASGRLGYAVAPRFVLSCSSQMLEGAVALARRNGWLLHTHASENPAETELVRRSSGRGNVAHLAEFGLAGRDTVLAHCVHLDDTEFALLARDGTGVAHCPGANLKLASGVANLPRLLRDGVKVGLGADGPPCNNRLSVFHEMALAGTVHNLAGGAGAVDPWAVLELATWRGAEVVGLAGRAGKLLPGWLGDVVVLSLETLAMEPLGDPAAMIVFSGSAANVRHVVVDGTVRVRDGALARDAVADVRRDARRAAADLESRLEWS